MRKEVKAKLNELKVTDVYSIILFALYKLKDSEEYSTLSELAYILDKKSLFNLCEQFGGMTITIPTIKEFKVVVNSLLLYQYVNIENIPFNQAIQLLEKEEFLIKDIKDCYYKLVGILDKYEFKRN